MADGGGDRRNFDPTIVVADDCETALKPLLARLADLEKMAAQVPKSIESRDDAERLADGLRMIVSLTAAVDSLQETLKKPHIAASKTVAACFAPPLARLKTIDTNLRPRLTAYLKKEQERLDQSGDSASGKSQKRVRARGTYGSIATLSLREKLKSWSRDEIDLEALRPFLDDSAIEKAIRAFNKNVGGKLRGVEMETVYGLIVN